MIINRRMDGIATMTRLFVYKIVVLNNTFPSVCIVVYICSYFIYDKVAVVEKRKNGKISAFY